MQSPDNTQSLNRYSYVLNRPMNFTDPSGYLFKHMGSWWSRNGWIVKGIVGIAIGVATAFTGSGPLAAALFIGSTANEMRRDDPFGEGSGRDGF